MRIYVPATWPVLRSLVKVGEFDPIGGTAFALSHLGLNTDVGLYIGFVGVVVNLGVVLVGTVLLKAVHAKDGVDQTAAADYFTDVPDDEVQAEPVVTAGGLA